MRTLPLLIAAGLMLVAGTAWLSKTSHLPTWASHSSQGNPQTPPTNDSFEERVVAEGRVATYHGEHVTLSAEMVGRILTLLVDEKDVVFKGNLIAQINADDLKARLAEAQARLAEIDAELCFADAELKRWRKLSDDAAISRNELDQAERNFEVATAQRGAALATIKQVEALLAKSHVYSPIDGVVLTRHAHPGEMAAVGTPLITVANINRLRIEAEIDEFDIGRVSLGQAVAITAESFPGVVWRGVVEEIPDSVSERRLKPLDPGRPTDARVLLVKIALQETTPLKLGQRVEVELRIR